MPQACEACSTHASVTPWRWLLLVAVVLPWGCGDRGTSGPVGPAGGGAAATDTTHTLTLADSALAKAVSAALGKPDTTLVAADTLALTSLSAAERGIATLDGLQAFTRLTTLDLSDNHIADLRPVASLTRLRFLELANNQVTDLTPLSRLTQLERLGLSYNHVQDVSPLARLPKLAFVDLSSNQIQDLAPLLGLDSLASLDVEADPLTDAARTTQAAALTARGVQVHLTAPGTAGGNGASGSVELAGPRIAFLSDRKGGRGLFVMDADGSSVVQIAHGQLASSADFAWSPDAETLLFTVLGNLYTASSVDGGDQRQLTQHEGKNGSPAWFPDGQHIVFFSNRHSTPGIYAMASDGSDVHLLVPCPDAQVSGPIAVSRDGTKIAFHSEAPAGGRMLVADADGSDVTDITGAALGAIGEYAPSWSPDGTKLALTVSRYTGDATYLVNADGSDLVRLGGGTPGAPFSLAAWSPRDGSIVYATGYGNWLVGAICASNAEGTDLDTLFTPRGYPESPRWSPDGSRITFCLLVARDPGEIYVMDADGSNPVNLTNNPAGDTYPVWSPR